MKIVIDMQSCQSGSKLGGIGRYSIDLVEHILLQQHSHEILVLLNNQLPARINEIRSYFKDLLPQINIICFDSLPNTAEVSCTNIAYTRVAECIREKFIADLKPDVLLICSLVEGYGDDVLTSIGHFSAPYITCVILYDLIPLMYSDVYLKEKKISDHYYNKLQYYDKSDILFAISNYSRLEGSAHLKVKPEQIINISSAISSFFRKKEISPVERQNIYSSYGIQNDFLLYTASFDIRKNHGNLIKAFSFVDSKLRESLQLVFVGNGNDDIYSNLFDIAISHGLSKQNIIFTGCVDDDTLLCLYNLCILFIFPSLSEGFGLPILEAMACGAPVIASNTTCIPDVVGYEDALFDPRSPHDIAFTIEKFLTDKRLYNDLKQHCHDRVNEFSWEKSAQVALTAIEDTFLNNNGNNKLQAVSRKHLMDKISHYLLYGDINDQELVNILACIGANERIVECYFKSLAVSKYIYQEKIGLVSTWNTRCGIASYSENIMRDYFGQFMVFAPIVDNLLSVDSANVVRCWTLDTSEDFKLLNDNIDNFGISTLFLQYNYGFADPCILAKFIDNLKAKGLLIFIQLHSTIDPPQDILPRKLSDMAESLGRCDKIFAMTNSDVQRLQRIGIFNVSLFPLGHSQIVSKEIHFQKKDNEIVLATYGFALPNKGILELIESVSGISVSNKKIKLLLVNAEYPVPESQHLIRTAKKLALETNFADNTLFITDYLADEESLGYLMQADMIIYPYQRSSESSSAAVRLGLLSKAPVIVTPLSVFDDVKDLVYFLPGTTVNSLREGITRLISELILSCNGFERTKQYGRRMRWILAREYSRLIQYFHFNMLISRVMSEGYFSNVIFKASDHRIQSEIGIKEGGVLRSNCQDGLLLYGPHINLYPGLYKLTVKGSGNTPLFSNNFKEIRLSYNCGQNSLQYEMLDGCTSKDSLTLQFVIKNKACNFEITIFVSHSASVFISELSFSSRKFFP
ncbi:glycosyltransferase [Desulfovibrio sp. TomC]|uniref:glycosyltransferase n=1 Tax=Desulfovibrio sp. TomC TaxID=1562888 RepID=UPI0005749BE2|nr:glycosyltransferase [Desulfovibrio sp. TomC]KHK00165.1 Mannosyltransferase [Desulfovibrio sp. TomC]